MIFPSAALQSGRLTGARNEETETDEILDATVLSLNLALVFRVS